MLFFMSNRWNLYVQDHGNSCSMLTYLFVEFNPEEVGVEGEGYIWRPEAESDDEVEQTRDVWGKDLFSLFVNMLGTRESCPRIPCHRLVHKLSSESWARDGINACDAQKLPCTKSATKRNASSTFFPGLSSTAQEFVKKSNYVITLELVACKWCTCKLFASSADRLGNFIDNGWRFLALQMFFL